MQGCDEIWQLAKRTFFDLLRHVSTVLDQEFGFFGKMWKSLNSFLTKRDAI